MHAEPHNGRLPDSARVLIIDDDAEVCLALADMIQAIGHEAECAYTLSGGLHQAVRGRYDVVFLDVNMPDGNGLDALPGIRKAEFAPEVIIITGQGDADGAELAIKSGAWDYIAKPASLNSMTLPLVRALQYRAEKRKSQPLAALKRCGIIGNSPQIRAGLDLLVQAATSETNVLITGETGTGKEVFARAIHQNSRRSQGSFVVVDCAALPQTLVESVLFGHERGAYTGADRSQDGLIVQADGGTLFLDEVGEMPLGIQKNFLRVLQERRFRPVGGEVEIYSDFRLLAATNRDLETMVRQGTFRSDLLFRLRALAIPLVPLRHRLDDLKELVIHHVSEVCEREGLATKGFSSEFFDMLKVYEWPGNIRELFNALESAISAAKNEHTLFPKHLPTHIRVQVARASMNRENKNGDEASIPNATTPVIAPLRDFRASAAAEAERHYLERLIDIAEGDIQQACRISQVSRSRLYELFKKYGLKFSY